MKTEEASIRVNFLTREWTYLSFRVYVDGHFLEVYLYQLMKYRTCFEIKEFSLKLRPTLG